MSKYASNTSVPVERSQAEIERLLAKYGATAFMRGWNGPRAVIGFQAMNRHIRFELPLPTLESCEKVGGRTRPKYQIQPAYDQAVRQAWRALALVIKAKLEGISSGITTFENEFLAHIVLPGGETFGEWAAPQLSDIYSKGKMPPLLPGSTHAR